MATSAAGLVRVTVSAPRRRIDIALPENVVVAEMLPILLRHGGEELADEGVDHGGWLLRRADGTALTPTRTLGAHRVRDGEVLHLAPGRQDWPELDYDDLVDAIATGSRRRGSIWARTHTRRFGLTVGGVVIGLALLAVFRSAGNPELAGRWALGQSLVLVLVAAVLSRVIGDSAAGAVAGLLALPYAFVGAALAVARPNPWPDLVASQFEVACAVTVLCALLAAFAVGSDNAPFAAVTVAGLLGVLGGWLTSSHGMSPPHVACVLLCVALLATPLFNALAIWLARVPIPALPRSATDLIRDQRLPPRAVVYAAVARADGLLTGLLAGTATTAAVADVILVRDPDVMANWLVVITSAAYLVRARTYVTVRQRLPLLLAGVTGPAALLIGPAMHDPGDRLSTAGPLLLAFGALAIVAGLGYARKDPGPYLRRYVEILEVLLILAVLPLAAAVLGLYARMHGLG